MDEQQPFFRRESVLRDIQEIAAQPHVAFFAGAGVTIDRSGLTWSALIEALLRPHVSNSEAVEEFLRSEGPLFAASAAHFLQDQASDISESSANIDTRQRMVDQLRVSLYSPATWRTGDLAPSIADAAFAWSLAGKTGERTSCVVTTNYDDYVFQALVRANRERSEVGSGKRKSRLPPQPELWFPTRDDPLSVRKPKRAAWVQNRIDCVGAVPCIHLHGYIPRNPTGSPVSQRFPVVSENDYFVTAPHSQRALVALMRSRAMVIVGASITDPPLIRALEATKQYSDRFPRWVLVPLEPRSTAEVDPGWSERRRLIQARLESLKLRPVFVDFYSQISQFFRELIVGLARPRPESGGAPLESTFYSRLGEWWDGFGLSDADLRDDTQFASHEYLSETLLPLVRETLGAPTSETMKLELWVRWEPHRERELRLFASSVGVWKHYEAMRTSSIPIDGSKDAVAQAFRSGRPFLTEPSLGNAGEGMDERNTNRWQTSLQVPVRSTQAEDGGTFTSAVFVLSSMTHASSSFLSDSRDRSKLAKVVELLSVAGDMMCDPDSYVEVG
ncbi:SIR2 family protein [Nocardioides marmoraquaticus]